MCFKRSQLRKDAFPNLKMNKNRYIVKIFQTKLSHMVSCC
uniref:Uncharacterized protein n=1 Tax=Romanomermis culicivorax TaxID=13658 RepID=A0A915J637_ROMCU